MRSRFFHLVLAVELLVFLKPMAAQAQLALPGAAPVQVQDDQRGAQVKPKPKSNAVTQVEKLPKLEQVTGQEFLLNGAAGTLQIENDQHGPRATRLVLPGQKISHPNETCSINATETQPVTLKPTGPLNGLERYEVETNGCSFALETLAGAVLMTATHGACRFPQQNCVIDPSGLWGPDGASFTPQRIKMIERERATKETVMRARYRQLIQKISKNNTAMKSMVTEQASFSAKREEICRNYRQEEMHGFCALNLVSARNFLLQSRLSDNKYGKNDSRDKKTQPHSSRTVSPPIKGALSPL